MGNTIILIGIKGKQWGRSYLATLAKVLRKSEALPGKVPDFQCKSNVSYTFMTPAYSKHLLSPINKSLRIPYSHLLSTFYKYLHLQHVPQSVYFLYDMWVFIDVCVLVDY